MKNLIKKYNSKDSILVISSWPRKKQKYSKGVCAVASFAKNTLLEIQKQNPNKKIVILTMKLGKKTQVYTEDGMLVIRCFERNNPLSYFNLLKTIHKFNKAKTVILEFEFASFGDLLSTGSLSLLVWAMAFLRKQVHLVVHQVILSLNEISDHIGINKKSLKMKFFNFALLNFYKFITFPAKTVIVLENELKNRLKKIIKEEKILVVPHGVDSHMKQGSSLKNLKEKPEFKKEEMVILFFGYLTWYKGVDFLIKALEKHPIINGRKIKLIIAGGPSFTQAKKKHYQSFLNRTLKNAKKRAHIQVTGFVPEDKISSYFKAADLVVLPYRRFMSSSGPFSVALSFEKPILLSNNLSGLLKSTDIQEVLKNTKLSKNDITFGLNEKDLVNKIGAMQDPKIYKKAISFSKTLANKRSFGHIANSYVQIISEKPRFSFNKRFTITPSIAS